MIILLTLLIGWLFTPLVKAQTHGECLRYRIVSYNVENLFDCLDDSLKADEEYLPEGMRHWTSGRYYRKINAIAKVLIAIGGPSASSDSEGRAYAHGEMPLLIGLYEVENPQTIEQLIHYSPLRQNGYRYVMTSSLDVRGIDIALLYRPDKFKLLYQQSIRANLLNERPTRDLLHVCGTLVGGDTLDVVLLHLPSRLGGTRQTEPYRQHVARRAKQLCDSLSQTRQNPHLLLMGDFNESATGPALAKTLKAKPLTSEEPQTNQLYNLLAHRRCSSLKAIKGSYKYQGIWETIDHIVANGLLLQSNHSPHLIPESAEIAPLSFLLTDDKSYGGEMPCRTYQGANYQGGYSDHLPLIVDIEIQKR